MAENYGTSSWPGKHLPAPSARLVEQVADADSAVFCTGVERRLSFLQAACHNAERRAGRVIVTASSVRNDPDRRALRAHHVFDKAACRAAGFPVCG